MSWKLTLVFTVWAGFTLGSPALAQRYTDDHPRYEYGLRTAPGDTFYIGGYSRDTELGQIIVDFYTRQDPSLTNDSVRFGAIPIARRSLDTGGNEPRVIGWADGRMCGQLQGVLLEYTRLVPPTFQTPSLYSAPPTNSRTLGGPSVRVHPIDSSVWGYARQPDGAQGIASITGSDGLIDRWTAFAEEQLDACWGNQTPSS